RFSDGPGGLCKRLFALSWYARQWCLFARQPLVPNGSALWLGQYRDGGGAAGRAARVERLGRMAMVAACVAPGDYLRCRCHCLWHYAGACRCAYPAFACTVLTA